MPSKGVLITAAAATAGVVGGAYCAYHIYQNYQESRLPTEWTEVGTLKDLYIYPIKSCKPVILNKAECTTLGLKDDWLRDRVLMVVDEKYNFITARIYPELLLVDPTFSGSILTLKHDDMEPIRVNLAEVIALQKPKRAQVWGITVPVYDCGWAVSDWYSRLLSKNATTFKLVYYASEECRGFKPNKFHKFTKKDTGAFPDETSYHIMNEASIDELNSRLDDGDLITHRYYRPNFVIVGPTAYDEDNWKFIKIGDNVFKTIKPCNRCVLTMTDPDTGMRNYKQKALETLKSYREIKDPEERKSTGNQPRLGLQIALRSKPGGIISVNDTVYAA